MEIREEASDAEARTGSNEAPSPDKGSLVDYKAASALQQQIQNDAVQAKVNKI